MRNTIERLEGVEAGTASGRARRRSHRGRDVPAAGESGGDRPAHGRRSAPLTAMATLPSGSSHGCCATWLTPSREGGVGPPHTGAGFVFDRLLRPGFSRSIGDCCRSRERTDPGAADSHSSASSTAPRLAYRRRRRRAPARSVPSTRRRSDPGRDGGDAGDDGALGQPSHLRRPGCKRPGVGGGEGALMLPRWNGQGASAWMTAALPVVRSDCTSVSAVARPVKYSSRSGRIGPRAYSGSIRPNP